MNAYLNPHIHRKVTTVFLLVTVLLSLFCLPAAADNATSEQILWDNDYVTVSFMKAEQSIGIIGYFLYLDVQNKSDIPIKLGVSQSAVNNYSCSMGFGNGVQITGGNSATVMTLLPTQLFYENLYNIQLKLFIIDDKLHRLAESDWIYIDISDPEGEPQPETEIDVPDPIIDNEWISISYLDSEPVEGIHSHKVMFHIINRCPNEVTLSIDQGALNGRMCASIVGSEFATILDGNKSICPFIFNMLEDIGEVENIQFRFHVRDNIEHEDLFVSDLIEVVP